MKRFVSGRPYWWQWFTILSLDAVSVSVVWQLLFARAAEVQIRSPESGVLGASVWLAYTADRWIEAFRLQPEKVRTQRHSFAARWRWPILFVWAAVLLADVTLAVRGLTRGELEAGFILLAAVGSYLLSHQLWHRDHPWRLPKELCVAGLITSGVLVFLIPNPQAQLSHLTGPALHFAFLCFLNCLLISFWEREIDQDQGQQSLALAPPIFKMGRLITWLPWIFAAETITLGLLSRGWTEKVYLCLTASALLLGSLDRLENKLGRQLARVLADVVLLTPIVILVR